jgi:hypothetical protein
MALFFLVAACLARAEARAADAVGAQTWDSGVVEESLTSLGDEAVSSGEAGLASSMANNPGLNGSAWAHTGAWWSLEVGSVLDVRIRVDATDPAQFAPGLSVWAIGDAIFDGGTTATGGETSTAGFGTPHSFNAFGPLGDAGTLWMQDGVGGNAKELLGYAISGPSFLDSTGWGETIEHGAHDLRASDDYVASVSGSVGAGFAELLLEGVTPGWYLIYVGGTDHSMSGGEFALRARAVPEPGTALLVAAGIACLARRRVCGGAPVEG